MGAQGWSPPQGPGAASEGLTSPLVSDLDFGQNAATNIQSVEGEDGGSLIIKGGTGQETQLRDDVGSVALTVLPSGGGVELKGNLGFYDTTPVAQSSAYTRNATVVEDRTLLASASATATNNNNVLAALVADLQALGLIG